MNSKFLFGVSVFVLVIITVVVISVLENESSLTEQKIYESIQHEILKSPQITGVNAQTICEIIDLECQSSISFQAVFDVNDGYTKFTYSKSGVDYFFRVIDDKLEYKTSHNHTEWTTFVPDDPWMWDNDFKAENETVNDDDLSDPEYSRTFHYEGDELGNYEQWCHNSNGIFSKDSHGGVACQFTDSLVYDKARDVLHELQETTITGELAQHLCDAYGKKCLPGIVIGVEYDLRTGHLLKQKKIDGKSMEFRIIDDVIDFRLRTYPPSEWVLFTGP